MRQNHFNALGVAADLRMQIARGAEGEYRESRNTLDDMVGYFVYPEGSETLTMRWPLDVCQRAGLNTSHARFPQPTDQKP